MIGLTEAAIRPIRVVHLRLATVAAWVGGSGKPKKQPMMRLGDISGHARSLRMAAGVLMRFVVKGRATGPLRMAPSRLLIVQMGKLGDMVCTTPMFKAVKDVYPQCTVDVLGLRSNQDLLRHDPSVNEYLVYSDDLRQLATRIRTNRYDFGCSTAPNAMGAYLLYTAGIPQVVLPIIQGGRSPYETRLYRFIRRFCSTVPHDMHQLALKQYLRLLEPIGIRNPSPRKQVFASAQARERVVAYLRSHGVDPRKDLVIGISPSVGNKFKKWGAERFAQVADRLCREDGATIIIVGSDRDRTEVAEMLEHLRPPARVLNTTGLFSLDELIALMEHFHVFVSVDTGPIYIADALGVGTADIVGPFASTTQRPMDSGKSMEVRADGLYCRPCSYVMDAKRTCWTGTHACTEQITVDMVLDAIRAICKQAAAGAGIPSP